ncbi:hypothetical protein SAMN05444851_0775 [Aliiroseovarius sediminilitoris]|uniref:Uncharacterized protein n=1 Tax=Aliiroseovarius sediminilitoris TaxID=1173584 RepID=A0A1I0NEN7_9RHOB|nr:hypothetical protein SAMN05444851_0775 [Aliiroseovarius sediminilitoris]
MVIWIHRLDDDMSLLAKILTGLEKRSESENNGNHDQCQQPLYKAKFPNG